MSDRFDSGGAQRIYAVFAAGLLLTSVFAIGSVGALTATQQTGSLNGAPTGNIAGPLAQTSLDFKGCSAVWYLFRTTEILPVTAEVTLSSDSGTFTETVTITQADLTTVPGTYGDTPLYKFEAGDGEKVVAATIDRDDATRIENPNRCAAGA